MMPSNYLNHSGASNESRRDEVVMNVQLRQQLAEAEQRNEELEKLLVWQHDDADRVMENVKKEVEKFAINQKKKHQDTVEEWQNKYNAKETELKELQTRLRILQQRLDSQDLDDSINIIDEDGSERKELLDMSLSSHTNTSMCSKCGEESISGSKKNRHRRPLANFIMKVSGHSSMSGSGHSHGSRGTASRRRFSLGPQNKTDSSTSFSTSG